MPGAVDVTVAVNVTLLFTFTLVFELVTAFLLAAGETVSVPFTGLTL